jgi:hypothetical protein
VAKPDEPYLHVIVESYVPASTSGKHGRVHLRPIAGQPFDSSLAVECSKSLATDYPVGTRFRLRAKLTDREGSGQFLYSSWRWRVEVVSKPKGK